MPRIQEIIHKFEEGEWTWTLKALVGLLLAVTLTAWYDFNEYQNFKSAEAMETAQLARNLARGEGFTTKCIRPLTIALVEQHQGPASRIGRKPHPDLNTPPVYPVLLAGLMKVLPLNYDITARYWRYQPEVLIALFNQGLFFLTIGLTALLARRLFDPSVALVTAIVLLGCDLLWRFSVSGLSTCLLLLILVSLLWVLVWLDQGAQDGQRKTGWFVGLGILAGVLIGLGALTRYAFGWLLLPVLGYFVAFLGGRRWIVGIATVLTFLALLTPWMARNYMLSGTPFGVPGYAVHQDTLPYPEARLERTLRPDLSKIEGRDYFRKIVSNAGDVVSNEVPRLGGGSWVTAFFMAGLFLRYRSAVLGRLRLFLIAALLVLIAVQAAGRTHLTADSPTINSENLMVLLVPPVFMFGTALFFVLLEQLRPAILEIRYLVIVGFIALASSPLVFTLMPPRSYPITYPPYLPPWIQESARYLRDDEMMMSDMPWAVAWYGDRNCIWTTLDTSRSFFTIHDEHKLVSALYLTPLTTDARFLTQILQSPDYEWSRFAAEVLTRTNLPTQFPLRHARKKYTPDQLLLCDRPRWQEGLR
ncbi:MAG TPA: glycosyltransferase family 39 protein [Verrucomicrobiota bacterium]|nr:glycosyltransferase family 39 protein [Verrucomicrobiota bacterium]HNU49469.1 glycosyltransferase family 39 protein [Verrucomicrobiota bacterium]